MGPIVHVLSLISVAIYKPFKPSAMSFVICPLTFEDTTVVMDAYSATVSFTVFYFSSIDVIFVLFDSKQLRLLYFFVVEFITYHRIVVQISFRELVFSLNLISCFSCW